MMLETTPADELSVWAERRPARTESERAQIAEDRSSHLPTVNTTGVISDGDIMALKAAFIRRFDEDLPRTETLFAVANIGYRMALRDLSEGKFTKDDIR